MSPLNQQVLRNLAAHGARLRIEFEAVGSLVTRHLGPAGQSELDWTVDTGIAGRFVLRRSPN